MSAEAIARSLSGRASGVGFLCRCPVPGHGQGRGDRNPSLYVADGTDGGLILRCKSGCEYKAVQAELRRRGLLRGGKSRKTRPRAIPARQPAISINEKDHLAILKARELWSRGVPIMRTPSLAYLKLWRGIDEIPLSGTYLRHLPRERPGCARGGLVAPIRRLESEEVIGVQIVWVDPEDGGKLYRKYSERSKAKKTIGRLLDGAVQFGHPAQRDGVLGLTEGIEDALSVCQMFDVPCWACLGLRYERVALPPEVKKIIIFADRDKAGLKEARRQAQLMADRLGHEVLIEKPDKPHKDFNDMLRARHEEGVP